MSLQRLLRKIRSVRQQGLVRSVRIVLDRFTLRILQHLYRFQRWYADAPLSVRTYRRTVAEMVNALRPECVVDVGCGRRFLSYEVNIDCALFNPA